MVSTVASFRSRPIPPELQDLIAPDFHNVNFSIESYIKKDLGLKLDKGWYLILERAHPPVTNNNDSLF